MVPTIDIIKTAENILRIYTQLLKTRDRLGNGLLAVFLDLIPERGQALDNKLKAYMKANKESELADMAWETLQSRKSLLFFPKCCTLDEASRDEQIGEISKAIVDAGASGSDDLAQIYFGETGTILQAARSVSCKCCYHSNCPHFIDGLKTEGVFAGQ